MKTHIATGFMAQSIHQMICNILDDSEPDTTEIPQCKGWYQTGSTWESFSFINSEYASNCYPTEEQAQKAIGIFKIEPPNKNIEIANALLTEHVYNAFGEPKDAWNSVHEDGEYNNADVEKIHFKLVETNRYDDIEQIVDDGIHNLTKNIKIS